MNQQNQNQRLQSSNDVLRNDEERFDSSSELVSVGVPVRNGGLTLRYALDSILCQSHTNLEIIISDNDSSDTTATIALEYQKRDERIIYHRQPRFLTALENLRFVLDEARGGYFMWAAHDDTRSPDFVSGLLRAMHENPDAILSFGDLYWTPTIEGEGLYTPYDFDNSDLSPLQRVRKAAKTQCTHIYGLWKTKDLQSISFQACSWWPDLPIMAAAAYAGKFKHVSGPCFTYLSVPKTDLERAIYQDAKLTSNKYKNMLELIVATYKACAVEGGILIGMVAALSVAENHARNLPIFILKKLKKIACYFDYDRPEMNLCGIPGSSASKVMLVTCGIQMSPIGGRAQLSRLIQEVLIDEIARNIVLFELPSRRLRGVGSIAYAFRGYIDGLDANVIARAIHMLKEKGVHKALIDGSNLGAVAKAIKVNCPDVEVSTLFHNCEARFFLGAFRQFRTLRSLGVLISNFLAERRAVRYSDKLICLSERDSGLLRKLYGRGATHISPMAMQDKLPAPLPSRSAFASPKYALFVGGAFYANQAGIAWFVEHVAPRISIRTHIVGQGLETLKEHLEQNGNVKIIGAVESLAQWYVDAELVIAPIFDGSGMKTKVAEALMFGKRVIGTPEAFSGYEEVAEQAGVVCATADEFVRAIEAASSVPAPSFDPALRALYERHYSYPAARARLAAILGAGGNSTKVPIA